MRKFLLLIILIVVCYANSFATHNRAGQITYRHISGLTYEFTVTIFADGTSNAFARKDIEINWGDGLGRDSLIVKSESPVDPNDRTIMERIWKGTHTFPGAGTYTVSVEDPNRNAGVNNIDNSVGVPFYLETTFRISPIGNIQNDSPQLLNDPIDEACVGQPFVHNPGAYDPNGDSLAYAIAKSKGVAGIDAPGFYFPPNMSVDPLNGDLNWNSPMQAGQINVAILIKEYRDGIFLGEILRDIQINIKPSCNNRPPTIFSQQEYCVEAGKTLNEVIRSTDPDSQDKVSLSASGAPFELKNNPAMFNPSNPANPVAALFIWNTLCEHVQLKPYEFSVRAVDNGKSRGSINLSTYKTHYVKVIAPAPDSFRIKSVGNVTAKLNWVNRTCDDAIGYKLYRRIDSSGFVPDSCTTGVPEGIGYTKIADIKDVDSTEFFDDNNGKGLVPGIKYCYLIVAYFEDGAESYASKEICIKLDKELPVITKVSVVNTAAANGVIDLEWSPATDLDTIDFPPPYRYLIHYKEGSANYAVLDSTMSVNDTTYTHSNINTEEIQHEYKIELWSMGKGRTKVGAGFPASSLFLNIAPTDRALDLSWNSLTPWKNDSFLVYRKEENMNNYIPIDTVYGYDYTDTALENGKEYCYYIVDYGSYDLKGIPKPLINLSQENCSRPIDNVPPCPVKFEVVSDCERDLLKINWEKGKKDCQEQLFKYQILYSPTTGGELQVIAERSGNVFEYFSSSEQSSGCYSVRGLDSALNQGEVNDTICADFCPYFELPNIFTPNGDGVNDLFEPIPPNNLPGTKHYRDIDSINLKIFNRWGEAVYQTTKIAVEWNGYNQKEKEFLKDGVYFYRCLVYEKSLKGLIPPRILKGNVTIVDGNNNRETKNE